MARLILILAVMLGSLVAAPPAFAQFPNIFESIFGPLPGSRPQGGQQGRPPGQQQLPPGPPPGPPRGVQPQALPPPSGGQVRQMPAGVPPQRPPAGAARPLPPGPTTDEVITEPPAQKIVNPTAIFAGLDKVTGRIITFDVAINETVRFGALEVTPRACYTRPPTETTNTDGFVEVDELTLQGELRRLFTGWMFATSPGLNAVEHPIYDIWLVDCKGAPQPTVTAENPPEQAAAQPQQPAPRPQPRPQQQQRRTVQPPLPPPPGAGTRF